MEIKICVPSYKRPKVETLSYLPHALVYVSNDELADYQRKNPSANIIGVDPKYQGNVSRIRNYILDVNRGDIVCIVDDDLKEIGYWENRLIHPLVNENEVIDFISRYSVVCEEIGAKMWGVNVNPDKQVYREYTPFSLTAYIGSPFSVHIDSPIRYDEKLSLKEDYDITLQHLNRYRKALRVNKYFYQVRQAEQVGGCAVYRNMDREREQLIALQRKWGSDIVKFDTGKSRSHSSKKKRGMDINPIIKVPISGI